MLRRALNLEIDPDSRSLFKEHLKSLNRELYPSFVLLHSDEEKTGDDQQRC